MSIDVLKALDEVLVEDQRWQHFGLSLASHHAMIAGINLNQSVPDEVRQQYENARSTWLYSFFSYRLLSVAILVSHTAAEAALKTRASHEGLSSKLNFHTLLVEAIGRRWIVDAGFSAAAERKQHWDDHRETLKLVGAPDCGPYVEPDDDQAHARQLVQAIRCIRNSVAHGETLLVPNIAPIFLAVAEFINQLFPAPR
jgi:hypothetical protein